MRHDLPDFELLGAPTEPADRDTIGEGTDLWFARRMAREHGANLKFVWEWRAWLAWQPDQGRWQRDAGAVAWSSAKDTVRRLLAEAASADEETGKRLLKAAHRFMGASALEAALKLARSEPAIVASPEEWDAQPHFLNCANGTIDLTTGALRPHRREDRLTKTTGVKCQPGAESDAWDSFIARVLPDAELRQYIQRAIGYSAIGEVTEHVLHVAWGSGANGKSVLFAAAAAALGEYAVTVPTSILLANGKSEHPTLLTTLRGARLALASETPEGGRFNEAQLKMLTGGDGINARGMRENYSEFQPSHTLWLATNHRPQAKETTAAFWRRMRLLPFTVTIPAEEQDKRLLHKLKAAAPAVLNWIIAGAVAYHQDGLEPPAIVAAATNEYRADEDELREFVEMYEPGGFTSCADLHQAYVDWCATAGLKHVGQRTLAKLLQERGFEYVKSARPRGFRITTVPKGKVGLISREDSRVKNNTENALPNGGAPATPYDKQTCGDFPNGGGDYPDEYLGELADAAADSERGCS